MVLICSVILNTYLFYFNFCSQLGAAYASATTGAVVTALGLKSLTKVCPFTKLLGIYS